MRRVEKSAWVLMAALVTAAGGCWSFPAADGGRFPCQSDSDCLQGAGYQCLKPAGASVGTCSKGGAGGTDGGTPGTDGGCASGAVVAPAVIDGDTTTTVSVYLPPGVQADTGAQVTLDGAHVGTLGTGAPADPAVVRYDLPLGPNLPAGAGKVLVVPVHPASAGDPACYQATLDVQSEAQATGLTVSPSLVDADEPETVHLVFGQVGTGLDPRAPIQVFARDESAQTPVVYPLPGAEVLPAGAGGGPPDTVAVAVGNLPSGKSYRIVAFVGTHAGKSAAAGLYVAQGRPPRIDRVNPTRFQGNGPTLSMALGGQRLGPDVSVALACGAGATPTTWLAIPQGGTATEALVTFAAPSLAATTEVPCTLYYRRVLPGTQSGGLVRKVTGLVRYGTDLLPWAKSQAATGKPHVEGGAAVVTASDGSRYLVVVGGRPSGGGTGPSTSVELSPLGDFGAPRGFVPGPDLPVGLQAPAVATWGNMVYVVGGFVGPSAASRLVYRSELLAESDRPRGLTADLILGPTGIRGGTVHTNAAGDTVLYYAVSVVRSGETRGVEGPVSFPVRVVIPKGVTATVSLGWMDDPDALSYRIYQGGDPGTLGHLADQQAGVGAGLLDFFEDDGTTSAGTAAPYQPGMLSPWASLHNPLPGPVGAAAAVVVPSDSGGKPTLIVAGGDAVPGGSPTAAISRADITMTAGLPDQTLGTFSSTSSGTSAPPLALTAARDHLQARLLERGFSDATQQPVPTAVFGPGQQAGGGAMKVESLTPSQGDAWASTTDDQPSGRVDGPALFLGALPDANGVGFLADIVGNVTSPTERSVSFDIAGTGVPTFNTTWSPTGTAAAALGGPLRASAQAAGLCYLVGGGANDPTKGTEVDFTIR